MNIKVQQHFIRWAFHNAFPTYDSKRNRMSFLEEMLDENRIDRDAMQYWLQEAFHQGAKAQQEIDGEK